MTSVYHPKHQPQLGRGIPVPGRSKGSRDCGPRTVQMGIAQLTRGQLVPSIADIRERMGKPGPQTTSTFDADRCVESYTVRVMAPLSRAGLDYIRFTGFRYLPLLRDAIKGGDYVQFAIDYGVLNKRLRGRTGDPAFTGGHSVGVHGWRIRDGKVQWQLFDPLDDGRRKGIPNGPRWVSPGAVIAAWRSFGAYAGIFRGGERR